LQADEQQVPDDCCRKKRLDLKWRQAFGSLGFAREDAEEFVPWKVCQEDIPIAARLALG
jgi:hypothetical protein